MTLEQASNLIKSGEDFTVEFKTCANALSKTVFETVSAFSNRYGGHLFLGVKDNRRVVGVNKDVVSQLKKDFIETLNDHRKTSPTLFLALDEIDYDGKIILHTYVPISTQVQLCNGRVFYRVQSCDVDITKESSRMQELYERKASIYPEREVFPYVTKNELRFDLVKRAQRMAAECFPEQHWEDMDPMQLFQHANLYETDWRAGKIGFNLAAILLFGRDDVIESCAPGFRTEVLVSKNLTGGDGERLTVGTNLIEAYDLLTDYVGKHIRKRLTHTNGQQEKVCATITRELVSNLLIHREYSKRFLARISIDENRLYAENWTSPYFEGKIDVKNFTPRAKNPLLSWFFVNIGRADYLGSGLRKLQECSNLCFNKNPEFTEGYIFKTTIPLVFTSPETAKHD
ncbi:MAG: putative DNA binding domain-containing protein [Christensenellaceae bacterium]|jgi:ATP-dependent DNA helicase RecG|nr:putative DNA binding domain-containing protein [Christensenellaceae bacterium]